MSGTRGATAVAVAIAIVASASACGGSSGSKGAPSVPSSGPTPATAKPTPAADRARAQSLLLVQDDLPVGWVSSGPADDETDKQEDQKLADCTGAFDPHHDVVHISGDDLDKGGSEISSSVTVVDTREHFLADVAAIESDQALSCLRQIFSEDLPKTIEEGNPGVKVEDLHVARVKSDQTFGEVTVGFRVTLTVTGPRGSGQLYVDEFQLGAGRDEVSMTFDSQTTPFDAALEQSVLAIVGDKIEQASR
jgi:hypothetical protein